LASWRRIQQKARDSKRKTDIAAIQAALESYYSSNNTYPALDDLNSASWRSTNLKGFDANTLKDPKGTAASVQPAVDDTHYGYVVTAGDVASLSSPTTCDGAGTPCTNFKISAKLEADGSTISKQSNN
jgi:type II secretory pathway pseudopilin PulG